MLMLPKPVALAHFMGLLMAIGIPQQAVQKISYDTLH